MLLLVIGALFSGFVWYSLFVYLLCTKDVTLDTCSLPDDVLLPQIWGSGGRVFKGRHLALISMIDCIDREHFEAGKDFAIDENSFNCQEQKLVTSHSLQHKGGIGMHPILECSSVFLVFSFFIGTSRIDR